MPERFSKGDYIRYSSNGVCLVEDIRKLDYAGKNNTDDFYILVPVNNRSSTIYVPVNNAELTSRMRRILSKEEIDRIIESVKLGEVTWIDDRKMRSESFKAILKRCDSLELMRLVSCIYLKKQDLIAKGKKLSAADDNILTQAESMVEDEFSFVLNLDGIQVGRYIRNKLGISEN